ncbi:MAG TPA: SMC family ATPase [Solirubrobacterales bacterium]|nr:SMC family ATPase [Solirubrobacterales bacterium]
MRLLRLEAENFRSFAEIDLDLNASGVFAITGVNGAGKSTIFAAIEWVLYGGRGGPGATRVAREGVKREECQVTLEFEVGGRLLRVTRIDGKDASLTDVAEEEQLANGLSSTSREVAVRLGLTREMFRGTFYAPQNEVEALADKDPRKRKDQLERLLGIRHLRKAVELAEVDAREQGLVLEGLRSEAPDVDELKAEAKRREKEARDAAPAVKRLKKEIATGEARLKKTNAEIDKLAAQVGKHASRRLEVERADGVFRLKKESLEGRDQQLRTALAARSQLAELEIALRGSEGLDALSALEAADADRLGELRDRRAEAKAELAHQERHREALAGEGESGVCPTCHQQLAGTVEDLIADFDTAIAAARRRHDELDRELVALEAATKAALEQREEMTRRMAVLREQAAGAQLLEKQVKAQSKEVEEAAKEVARLRKSADKIAPEPGAQEEMSAERDRLSEVLEVAREALEEANRKASAESEAVAAARSRLNDASKLKKRIDEERRELELRAALAGALEEYREEASRRARPMVEAEASRLLRQITEAAYPRVRLTEDYFLEIAEGRDFYLSKRFSGGEQDLAALCLRLALARTLAEQRGTEQSFVILDEVFGSQDVGRRRMLMDQLIELSRGEFQQIFVISHTDDIVDQCSLHIAVSRENGVSSVAEQAGY